MAATIGHVKVELLARVADGEPVVIGTMELPLEARMASGHAGELVIDPARMRARIAQALGEASGSLTHQ